MRFLVGILMMMVLPVAGWTEASARPLTPALQPSRTVSVEFSPSQVTHICAEHWKQAKQNKAIQPGETWPKFLERCRSLKGELTPVGKISTTVTKVQALPVQKSIRIVSGTTKKIPSRKAHAESAKQNSLHERMRTCGAQWKKDKASGVVPSGQTWPAYWSTCNTRMKAAKATPATPKP
jgi:hypothetical protein